MPEKSSKSKPRKKTKEAQKDLALSYNEFKVFEGQRYTGMKVGRSHKWNYDAGVWKETKITPEEWQISFAVNKHRYGHAPEGSGVPVGTEYHWYIMAHQNVRKLDANTYTTAMSGAKLKLAHKRADHEKWNISEKAQRKKLIKFLYQMIAELEKEPQGETKPEPKAETAKSVRRPKDRKRRTVKA